MLALSRRCTRHYATARSLFELFPKTFPHGGPPNEPFTFQPKALRREFRLLQSQNHPDRLVGSKFLAENSGSPAVDADVSSLLNKAYTTIQNPYMRIAHIIELHHPDHLDITSDEVAKAVIAEMQQDEAASAEYKGMLMSVLEAHETLEFAGTEQDLEPLADENDQRIAQSEADIQALLDGPVDWRKLMVEAIRLKYWVNIKNGIKQWEQGKPVHLTH